MAFLKFPQSTLDRAAKWLSEHGPPARNPDTLTGFVAPDSRTALSAILEPDMHRICLPKLNSAEHGYCIIDLAWVQQREGRSGLIAVANAICTVGFDQFQAFEGSSLWAIRKPKPTAAFDASEGFGPSPLHTDFVNSERPPDYSCLIIDREDPHGGGASLISNLVQASLSLEGEDHRQLCQQKFVHGKFYGLRGLGNELNPFPVISYDDLGCVFRFTEKLGQHGNLCTALTNFSAALRHSKFEVKLKSGQLIIYNQRIVAHGRTSLGPGQESIPEHLRRTFLHSFGRARRFIKSPHQHLP